MPLPFLLVVVNCFQISYLWHTGNRRRHWKMYYHCVVNCFQISYLWHTGNRRDMISFLAAWLWIAFKFLIFDILATGVASDFNITTGCELLSNFLSLTYWQQVRQLFRRDDPMLWIAFKFLIFDILATGHAFQPCDRQTLWIAFKFLIFDILATGQTPSATGARRLWIAFKFLIFDILATGKHRAQQAQVGCELLSNFLSLTYWQQVVASKESSFAVVNCFQISYLWHTGNRTK